MKIIKKETCGLTTISVTFMAGREFGIPGLPNLVQRMIWAGSQKYDRKHYIQLPQEWGGKLDAGINDIYACYTLTVFNEYIEEAVDLLNNLLNKPLFDKADLEKNKCILKEEYSSQRCDTYKLLIDQIVPHFYDERFDEITIDNIIDFYNKYYINPYITVVTDADINNLDIQARYDTPIELVDNYIYSTNIKWGINTNRMVVAFELPINPINKTLTKLYGYHINKKLRLEKSICSRNCCKLINKSKYDLLIICVEYSNISNKDTILDCIETIIMDKNFTEREYNIAKNQLIGEMRLRSCDPIAYSMDCNEFDNRYHMDFNKVIQYIQEYDYMYCRSYIRQQITAPYIISGTYKDAM